VDGKRRGKQDIVDALREQIACGVLSPGDKLPSERALGETHGVSRDTVREALKTLANSAYVESRHGSGWFVRELDRLPYPVLTIDAGRARSTMDVWDTFVIGLGRTAGNRMEVSPRVVPGERVRTELQLAPGEEVVRRHRLRYVDGEIWAISTAYWPRWLAAGNLIEQPVQCSPLRVAGELGHRQERVKFVIGARTPSGEEAEILGTGRGISIMEMHTIGIDAGGRPIRVTVDLFPSHRFELVGSFEMAD